MNKQTLSDSDESESVYENTYCILLHIVEGVGFNKNDLKVGDNGDKYKNYVLLKASLQGVKFEVEGRSLTKDSTTVFNSNCIWESELADVKRMKTDNRPIKIECSQVHGRAKTSDTTPIGSLLLPIRSLKPLSDFTNVTCKLQWHKLNNLNPEFRQNKPELSLMLLIVKKALLDNGQLDKLLEKRKMSSNQCLTNRTSQSLMSSVRSSFTKTSSMLQSQSNIYVQLLDQVGLIQIGNNPQLDCDVFAVSLTFKQITNIVNLIEMEYYDNPQESPSHFIFHYDILGNNSKVNIEINQQDCYPINEKVSINFKTSLKSLRSYFERVFYLPINLFFNGFAMANYNFNLTKLLPPDDLYFKEPQKQWTKTGSFNFTRLDRILSPKCTRPLVDYVFQIELINSYSKKNYSEQKHQSEFLNDTFTHCLENTANNQYAGDWNRQQRIPAPETYASPFGLKHISFDYCMTTRHFKHNDLLQKQYPRAISEPSNANDNKLVRDMLDYDEIRLVDEFIKEAICEKPSNVDIIRNSLKDQPTLLPKQYNTISVETDKEPIKIYANAASATEPLENSNDNLKQQEDLTLKIVEELEEWKSQQMKHFLQQLTRREQNYLNELQLQWEQKRLILQARLESKLAQCDQLNAQLEQQLLEVQKSADKNRNAVKLNECMKFDLELNYTRKFTELDSEMKRLKMEMQRKDNVSEIKAKQLEIENTRLEKENMNLAERIDQLEKQLANIHSTHIGIEQYKEVLKDLHTQNEKFASLETSRNYYKDEWSRAAHELNKLQIKILKYKEKKSIQKKKSLENASKTTLDLCLKDILNKEQETLKSDRSELKSIKEMIFSASSTSSSSEDSLISIDPVLKKLHNKANKP